MLCWRDYVPGDSGSAVKLFGSSPAAVMAWICVLLTLTSATLTLEVDVELHVTILCVVLLAAAWAEVEKSKSAHVTERAYFLNSVGQGAP